MNEKIKQSLENLFINKGHRILFWYDREQELREEFEALDLADVEKIEILNNEFAIKHYIMREHPERRFLLYHAGPAPTDSDNWLLDVLLANEEFRADQLSIWLGELELGPEYGEVVRAHEAFFKAQSRREALRSRVSQNDSPDTIRLKMLAVLANCDARLESVLESLLAELAEERTEISGLIERAGLDAFLWKRLASEFNYQSSVASIKDFAIELFKSIYALSLKEPAKLNADALLFFKRWKNGRSNSQSFSTLSDKYATMLSIEADLAKRSLEQVIALDYFALIDQKIIVDLRDAVTKRTLPLRDYETILRERRNGFWYDDYSSLYDAIDYGARFIAAIDSLELAADSAQTAIHRYRQDWYKIDQLYRKFRGAVRLSNRPTLLASLSEKIENLYNNHFILPLSHLWQGFVDATERWRFPSMLHQGDFYTDRVQSFIESKKKIFVIISDALRYEIGEEFVSLIRKEDRYDAEIEAAISSLPSYTQLGMAALLPHQQLSIDPNKGLDTVFVDGKSSQGIENRSKILAQAARGKAIHAEDFLKMTLAESRELLKAHDVIYLYHNRIDAVGDKRDTEERVFEAVEETLRELINLVKKLQNANANNFFLTADHGFLYQEAELEESDFLSDRPAGEDIIALDRRFVIGQGLSKQAGFKQFTAEQLQLEGDFELQIPKGINRLRKQGSGSRYVHGGTSLQEIIIPVIHINKKRSSDISRVPVSIVRGTNQIIATGQLTVKLYQELPVTEKIQARRLSLGLYTKAGQLISQRHEITFDFTSEIEREREKTIQLILSKEADAANNQQVYLRLMEQEAGTSHELEHTSAEYTLRRSFTSDFDF